jgi:tyrosine-specific transport protein
MDSKILGSILLIVGTTIGAGMLALPIATAQLGFFGSIVLLFGCWFIMTSCAFLLLEVNLCMPANSNLVTMARATLGPVGQIISWVTFLLLLYSLLSAYISGGSGLLQNLFAAVDITVSEKITSILFTVLFGMVVFLGVRAIDYCNRGLMFIKLGGYVLLMVLLMPFVSLPQLGHNDMLALTTSAAMMVTVTSFGYSVIVPSLRIYLGGDVKKLKKVIFIGSLIPLICYILWDIAIIGVIPLHGPDGLAGIMQAPNSTNALVANLSTAVSSPIVNLCIKLFTSVCVLTSFLGVSLCLTDFLADGFEIEKVGFNRIIIQVATYLPPLLIVLVYPNAFIKALEYAGIYSVVLLILIPAWMAYCGRSKFQNAGFRVPGGKPFLLGLIFLSLAIILYSIVC